MFARSLVILLFAAVLAPAGETKKDEAPAKAKALVEKQVTEWKGENFKAEPVDEKCLRDMFPGHVFVAVHFPVWPVARVPAEPLKSQNLFAVSKDGKLTHLPDSKKLEEFFKSTLGAQLDQDKTVKSWVRLRMEYIQDGYYKFKYPEKETAGYRMAAPPAYFNGTLYTSLGVSDRHIHGGLLVAIDGRTGAIKWVFNTIPQKPTDDGWEIAKDTWTGGERAGGGVWTQPAIDAELGLLYINAGNPSPVYEGTARHGINLFTNSILALRLDTGKLVWHYQAIHHDVWDWDLVTGPILFDVNVGGKSIKAVAVSSKQAFLCVFDRQTGQPVWPIEERPVEKGNAPGEWYSPTQPFPTKPPVYSRNGVSMDDLIDFTPQMREQAKSLVSKYRLGPVFTPPVLSQINGPLATLTLGTASGGTNWPGASYDPETHIVYAFACNACLTPIGLVQPPKDISDMNYVAGTAGQKVSR